MCYAFEFAFLIFNLTLSVPFVLSVHDAHDRQDPPSLPPHRPPLFPPYAYGGLVGPRTEMPALLAHVTTFISGPGKPKCERA